MKLKKHLLTLLSLLAISLSAQAAKNTVFSLPGLGKAPKIDGIIKADEYRNAAVIYGFNAYNSNFLNDRQGIQYFAVDGKNFYWAMKSELPPAGMDLLTRVSKRNGPVFLDDNVEFLIAPPDAAFVYHVLANFRGTLFTVKYPIVNGGVTHGDSAKWQPASIKTASRKVGKDWHFEAAIPLSEIGLKRAPEANDEFRLLAGRNWTRPHFQSTIKKATMFNNPDEMAKFVYSPALPHVKFLTLGDKVRQGTFDVVYEVVNSTKENKTVACQVQIISDSAPRQIDQTVKVAPGKSVQVKCNFSENNTVIRNFYATFRDLKSGKILHNREFIVDPNLKPRWVDPKKVQSAELEFGVYPYFKKLKVRFGNPAQKTNSWKSGSYTLLRDGKKLFTKKATKNKYGFADEFSLELLPGKYVINASFVNPQGKAIPQKAEFKVEKFPWEHNTIGMDRIIIPPFKKLTYPGSRQIKATLTGYSFKDGFFNAISAGKEKNILAAPIQFVINGKPAVETSFRFVEKSADRAITASTLKWQHGTIDVKGEFDYDGFCKFTLDVKPAAAAKIQSAVIRVPLKASVAKLYHTTCDRMRFNDAEFIPQGKGVVWGSRSSHKTQKIRGSFRPYLWFGGLREGLSWVSETDRFWSVDAKKDALTIERSGNAVIFNVNIVNKPTVWKKNFTLQQAFQATPVKPQPDYRRKLAGRSRFPNAWTLSTLSGPNCWGSGDHALFSPEFEDFSFIKYLKARKFENKKDAKFVDDYMARNMKGYSANREASVRRHMLRGIMFAKNSEYIIPYTNPRTSWLEKKDYQTYMDEWWCSEYRAMNADQYNNTTTKSFQDMILYNLRNTVRAGLEGVYYDNIRDWANPNLVTGPAYHRADGTVQPYFDFFDLRQFVKRTAIMLYQEKKTFPDGRPVLTFHMTNTNLVPILSWGSISLDLEAQYGSKDFQARFSEGYLQSCTIGTQTGVIPEILIQITGNLNAVTRTFTAVTLAYDLPFIMNGGGTTSVWTNTWRLLRQFGYSNADVKVYPCWEEGKKPANTDCKAWRLASYHKPAAKELIVAVCSFGDTATGSIVVPDAVSCVDLESKKAIPLSGNKVRLSVKKHDFKLLKFMLK